MSDLFYFENDDGADLVGDLASSSGIELLVDAIDFALEELRDEYLEAPSAARAIAACEVLARANGKPGQTSDPLNEDVDAWLSKNKIVVPPSIQKKALKLLKGIVSENSELHQNWEEVGEPGYLRWRNGIADLRTRIGSIDN